MLKSTIKMVVYEPIKVIV